MEKNTPDSVLDKALNEAGQDGKFQKSFDIFYNVFAAASWAMCYMNIFLVLTIPPHTCDPPQKPENVNYSVWLTKYIPNLEQVPGKVQLSDCTIYVNPDVNNDTSVCSKYIYNKTWFESTVPTDNDWVCSDELYVANVFAYSRIGEMIGAIVFGWFGDIYGRRLSYIIALVFILTGRLISVMGSKIYILFLTGCVISCFPSWAVMQSITVLSLETTSAKRRTWSATLRSTSFSIGMFLMPFFYWWLKHWKSFMIVTSAFLLPVLLFSWWMIESPRWLWVEGKPKESLKYLKRIAKTNNRKINLETEKELLSSSPLQEKAQNLGPLALFSSWRLGLNTILQLLLWISVSVSYTVLLLSAGEKSDGNPFLSFSLQCIADIPGYFMGEWLADRFGRFAGMSSYSTMAAMWILLVIRASSSTEWVRWWWLSTGILVVSRLSTTVAYYTISLFNMELYPTCIRQSGMSLGSLVSSAATAVAPYVLYLEHRIDPRLSGAILASASLVAAFCAFLLPETKNEKLPETLEDAHTFGKDRKYFSLLKHENVNESA